MKKLSAILALFMLFCLTSIQLMAVDVPGTQASGIVFSNVSSTSARITFTRGSGSRRVVVVSTSSTPGSPSNGTTVYTDGSGNYGDGYNIGGDGITYVVMNSNARQVTVNGLTGGQTYWVKIFEYNYSGTDPNQDKAFKLDGFTSSNPRSFKTNIDKPTALHSAYESDLSFKVEWTNPSDYDAFLLRVSSDNFTTYDEYTIDYVTGTTGECLAAVAIPAHSYQFKMQTWIYPNNSDWTDVTSTTTATTKTSPTTPSEINVCNGSYIHDATWVHSEGTCYWQTETDGENGVDEIFPVETTAFSTTGTYYLREKYNTEAWSDVGIPVQIYIDEAPTLGASNNVSDVSLCGIYSDGQPGDPLVLDGSMDGTATSENPMHYDWYKVVNPIPIHTSINDGVATIIDALILADDADYRLDAWNICGHYPPMNFHVYVGDGPPIPTAGLGSVYGCIGYDATFDMNPSKWELKHPIQEVTYTLRYDPQGILQVDLQTNTTGIFSVMDAWNQYNSDNGYPPLTGGLTSAQAGEYVIYAMNGCGANIDLSSGAHLYVIDGTTTASVSLDQPEVCSKTTVNFTATSDGDSHDKTYQWKYEGSDIVGATNSTLTFETDATHSDYTRGGHYSVFVQNYCGAGTTSDEVLLTVNALPLATVSHGSLSFCNGGSVELRADGGTSWLWSPTGEISQSITVTTSGTYSVVVTGDHGCTNTSTDMLVTVWDLPVATVAVTDPLCEGDNGNVEISATGGSGTYVSGTGSHTVLAGDPYSFTVTDGNGCTSNVISGTMYAPTAIVASVVVTDPLCEGTSGNVEISATGGTGTYTSGTGSHSVLAGDAYSFTVTDGNGCTSNVISGTMYAPVSYTHLTLPTIYSV